MIRSATPDDAAAIAAIYAPIVRDTTISFELTPLSEEQVRARIVTTLRTLPWLVSVDDAGAVDGYVYAGKHRDAGAYEWSVNTSVYVRDDCRGQGVGQRMYQALFAKLVGLGYYRAFAGIALPNDASVALHERVGFEPIGVYRAVGYKFGAWRDVGWWQKSLRPLDAPVPVIAFSG